MKKIFLLFSFFFIGYLAALPAQETNTYFCDKSLDSLPIQAGGRVRPLLAHAEETLKFLTDKKSFGHLNATEVYCLLSLESMELKNNLNLSMRIDHQDVKKLLGLDENAHFISYKDIFEKEKDLRMEIGKQKESNSYKKELIKIINRIDLYASIISGENWTIATLLEDKIHWSPLPTFLTEERAALYKAKRSYLSGQEMFASMLKDSEILYKEKQGDHYLLELRYVKLHLFSYAMVVSLVALFAFFIFKKRLPGLIFLFSSVAIQVTAIVMRVLISGRAPVTNMYETVMFSGLGALILGVILFSYQRKLLFLIAGLCYNLCGLLMMTFANNMLDSSIKNLVPVLRDNFWLSTHVTTVILSYGALALSWILANIVLIKKRFFSMSSAEFQENVKLIHSAVKYGVVLLATGIILGGVWADYSWGRFWGWDPKETWSLIVFMIYMAILHGRYSSWVTNERFVPLIAGSFMSVMMAWFGVNYILATGLHSYGFSEGGAIFLGTFFLIQIGILVVTLMPKFRTQS